MLIGAELRFNEEAGIRVGASGCERRWLQLRTALQTHNSTQRREQWSETRRRGRGWAGARERTRPESSDTLNGENTDSGQSERRKRLVLVLTSAQLTELFSNTGRRLPIRAHGQGGITWPTLFYHLLAEWSLTYTFHSIFILKSCIEYCEVISSDNCTVVLMRVS